MSNLQTKFKECKKYKLEQVFFDYSVLTTIVTEEDSALRSERGCLH